VENPRGVVRGRRVSLTLEWSKKFCCDSLLFYARQVIERQDVLGNLLSDRIEEFCVVDDEIEEVALQLWRCARDSLKKSGVFTSNQ